MKISNEDYAELVRIGDMSLATLRSNAYALFPERSKAMGRISRGNLIARMFEVYLNRKEGPTDAHGNPWPSP